MRARIFLALTFFMVAAAPCAAAPLVTAPWRIVRDRWSADDERGFGDFVAAIGNSRCSSTESCLRDPANPYHGTDGRFVDVDVDCAKLPYLLRAYYAWKNGLPFSYVDGVSGAGDLRYSPRGNHVVSRHDLIDRGAGIDGPSAIREMLDTVSSATYRIDAGSADDMASDFYSPAIAPGSIRPGTVIYDPNGHVGIVYKVDADGRIYYMDAHPDFTITRSVYGAQFGQSSARLGGGLKNWRPFHLEGARREGGVLVSGHAVMTRQQQIPDFSLVQYLGTDPRGGGPDGRRARFSYGGVALGFYEYVRVAVSGGRTSYNPVYELRATMRALCNDLGDRAQSVDLAISAGMAAKPHPARLPDDIFSSDDGDWESYATPARDLRTRAAFAQFARDLGKMIGLWLQRDPRIVYDGIDLKGDLLRAYDAESQACIITYLNSLKRPVPVTFDAMTHRLFALSFDPYDCIELRWGAQGGERASCPNGEAKIAWYAREQGMRNMTDRDGEPGDMPPPVDVRALIAAMPERIPFAGMAPVGR